MSEQGGLVAYCIPPPFCEKSLQTALSFSEKNLVPLHYLKHYATPVRNRHVCNCVAKQNQNQLLFLVFVTLQSTYNSLEKKEEPKQTSTFVGLFFNLKEKKCDLSFTGW